MTRAETNQVITMLSDIQRRLGRLEANFAVLLSEVQSQGIRISTAERERLCHCVEDCEAAQ